MLLPLVVSNAPMGSVLTSPPVHPQFAVTFTVKVQLRLAGIEPPIKVTLEAPTVAVPPQVFLAMPETIMPTGNVSVSGAISRAAVLLELRKVMVRVEFPPAVTMAGLKDLRRVGGTLEGMGVTVNVATAAPVLLPLLVCSAPLGNVLTKAPVELAVTFAVTVQEPFAGMEPPAKVMLDVPAVLVPPQLELALPDTSMPLGNMSISGALNLAGALFELLKVMVRVETPPDGMEAGLKDFRRLGATLAVIVKVAPVAPVLLPMLVCSAPTASVLMKAPGEFAVTFTVTVQEPLAGTEPPVNVTVDALIVVIPAQVLLALPETSKPTGNVSVSGAVSAAAMLFGLVNVMVRVEIPPDVMAAGLKDLRSVGETFEVTVNVAPADAVLAPLLVLSTPTANVLMKAPAEFVVTFTVTVQEPLAGMEPPVSVTPDAPTVAAPPQVVPTLPDTSKPLGNMSVSGAESEAAALLRLVNVMVRAEIPPDVMAAGLKVFRSVGATFG